MGNQSSSSSSHTPTPTLPTVKPQHHESVSEPSSLKCDSSSSKKQEFNILDYTEPFMTLTKQQFNDLHVWRPPTERTWSEWLKNQVDGSWPRPDWTKSNHITSFNEVVHTHTGSVEVHRKHGLVRFSDGQVYECETDRAKQPTLVNVHVPGYRMMRYIGSDGDAYLYGVDNDGFVYPKPHEVTRQELQQKSSLTHTVEDTQ